MNCIIVDDEIAATEELKYFIENFSNIHIIETFSDACDTIKKFNKNNLKIDIAFLDISMPLINGMELAKILKENYPNIKIIFITAHKDYAVDAFEIKAYDYILKPFSKKRIISLLNELEKVIYYKDNINNDINNYMNKKNNQTQTNLNTNTSINNNLVKNTLSSKITIWDNDKMIVINIDDIDYFESNERNTTVSISHKKYTINNTLSNIAKTINNNFFKCHRSYIVNLNKVTEVIPWFNSTYMLTLKNADKQIPVSRNNIPEFRIKMNFK